MNIEDLKTKIPQYVFDVGRILNKEGFKSYLIGGSVRDILMEREPKDYDIGTNALPSEILKIFPRAISTGAKFGSIIVLVKDKEGETHSIDVTTFRVEEEYIGGRWPSKVEFTDDLMIDLSRRDFTINAIAIDINKLAGDGKNEIIFDPFKGRDDIQRKLVRAVGDPNERMSEDALRALRACRFASVLDFKLDKGVIEAVNKSVLNMIDDLSSERVRGEILKIIFDSDKPSVGLNLLKDLGILKIWIPELLEGIGVEQPEYHTFDVYNHLVKCVDAAPSEVRLAALFHDIGKPRKKEGKHFYGHDVLGASMTREIMKRLRFSNKEIEKVTRLVRWHMFYFPYDEDDFQNKKSTKREKKDISKWTDAAIRRFVRNVGGEEEIDDLIKLRIADSAANPKSSFDSREIEALQRRISEVRVLDMAIKISDLDISGNDIIKLGFKAGPEVGIILRDLLEMVIEDPSLNDKEVLLNIVKRNEVKYKDEKINKVI